MKISALTEGCISSGNCVLTAPALFDQDDEGLVVVKQPRPNPADHEAARAAAAACPVAAIAIEEEGEGR